MSAMALKSPAVAPAEGLLTEAVLKHACVVPNRRPCDRCGQCAFQAVDQVCVIGYFAKISSIRLKAFSAAAWGVALS